MLNPDLILTALQSRAPSPVSAREKSQQGCWRSILWTAAIPG
jgi:hypothetical protein